MEDVPTGIASSTSPSGTARQNQAASAISEPISNLPKKNFRHAGVLAKSGVLMKKDLHLQKREILRIYMHKQLVTHRVLISAHLPLLCT